MRCLLIGNYGVGNVGDEALRDYFLRRFPEQEWTVVSAHPLGSEVPRLPAGLRSLLRTSWWRTIGAMRHSDAVIFGGGSLFTDIESPFACFLWWLHAAAAKVMGRPVYLAFQGIGPFRTQRGERLARRVVEKAAFVCVRDSESATRIASWKLSTPCVLSADPVFLLAHTHHSQRVQNVLAVIPRRNSDAAFQSLVKSRIAEDSLCRILLISLQPDDLSEQKVLRELRSLAPERTEIVAALDIDALLNAVASASRVLTQRYHGAIAAVALRVPVEICPQGEGDKMWALRKALENNPEAEAKKLFEDALRGEKALKAALNAQEAGHQRA
jgi:polysaccharide pyruvyl transferase CsaB